VNEIAATAEMDELDNSAVLPAALVPPRLAREY
jgi:hypothetical protein